MWPSAALLLTVPAWIPNQAGVWPADRLPVPYCLLPQVQNTDLTPARVEAELQGGIDLWLRPEQGGSLACIGFRMERVDEGCRAVLDPGDPLVNIHFESDWELDPQVLGYTLSRIRNDSDCGQVVDDTGTRFDLPCRVGSDIALNDRDGFWSDDSSTGLPIRTVVGHEVGHLLGLGHCDDNMTCPPGTALMFGRYSPQVQPRLEPDDVEGACALYPPRDLPAGWTCQADGECSSRICGATDGPDVRVCTLTCSPPGSECPEGTVCRADEGGPSDRRVCRVPAPEAALGEGCVSRACQPGLICRNGVCALGVDAGAPPDSGTAPDGGQTPDGGNATDTYRGDGGCLGPDCRLPPIQGSCRCLRTLRSRPAGLDWGLWVGIGLGIRIGLGRRRRAQRATAPAT